MTILPPIVQKEKKINLNVKTGLAKLMAGENITVIHSPKATTASFDINNRVCVLPMLKDMTGHVYDWFIAHEMSHALYTPPAYGTVEPEIPRVFLNITEDARIEKLIKRKYPGSIKDCYNFYKKFSATEEDFFGLKGKNIDKFTLLDRVNLYFKIGSFIKVPFSKEEQPLVVQTGKAETFEEAVAAAKAIYEFMKKTGQYKKISYKDLQKMKQEAGESGEEQKPQKGDSGREGPMVEITDVPPEAGKSGDKKDKQKGKEGDKEDGGKSDKSTGNKESGKSPDSGSDEDAMGQSGDGDKPDGDSGEAGKDNQSAGSGDSEGESEEGDSQGEGESSPTSDSTKHNGKPSKKKPSENAQGSCDEESGEAEVVLPADTGATQKNFDESFAKQILGNIKGQEQKHFGDLQRFDQTWKDYIGSIKTPATVNNVPYNAFISSIASTVNMMVSYFNMKKSAADYRKSSLSKSGKLDTDKLSQYRTREDIFLRSETVHESKNHGMIMMIDWSGSMDDYLRYTLKQLIVLMEFCKKVQIPFEVYGFTNGSSNGFSYPEPYKIAANMDVTIFKMFGSEVPGPEFRKTSAHVYNSIVLGGRSGIDRVHKMGGTPINSMAIMSEYVIRNFKQKFNKEKTIFIMLSDGDDTDQMHVGRETIYGTMVMRDSETGRNYTHEQRKDGGFYHTLFKYVKEKCNVTKMVGFFLTPSVSQRTVQVVSPSRQEGVATGALQRLFREQQFLEFGKDIAFDKYFVLNISNFDVNMDDGGSLDINELSSEKVKEKRIKEFLASKTKPLIFMRKFIEEIS